MVCQTSKSQKVSYSIVEIDRFRGGLCGFTIWLHLCYLTLYVCRDLENAFTTKMWIFAAFINICYLFVFVAIFMVLGMKQSFKIKTTTLSYSNISHLSWKLIKKTDRHYKQILQTDREAETKTCTIQSLHKVVRS